MGHQQSVPTEAGDPQSIPLNNDDSSSTTSDIEITTTALTVTATASTIQSLNNNNVNATISTVALPTNNLAWATNSVKATINDVASLADSATVATQEIVAPTKNLDAAPNNGASISQSLSSDNITKATGSQANPAAELNNADLVLADDALRASELLGTQRDVESQVNPLPNMTFLLNFKIDLQQHLRAFLHDGNEVVVQMLLQRMAQESDNPGLFLITQTPNCNLERKITRALYDFATTDPEYMEYCGLSKESVYYCDIELLLQSSRPLSFFTDLVQDYRVIIINNIQLCFNSKLWQLRLCDIFNLAKQNNCVVIFNCALTNREFKEASATMLVDLRSRLSQFLQVTFEPLSSKYFQAYVEGRVRTQGLFLNEKALQYLTQLVSNNSLIDIDSTAFRTLRFVMSRNFKVTDISKHIIDLHKKRFFGFHLRDNKYVSDRKLEVALNRRLDKLDYFSIQSDAQLAADWKRLKVEYESNIQAGTLDDYLQEQQSDPSKQDK